MKPAHRSLLLHPLFLVNLIIVFANDNWWKYAYSGWLTGKLSDVAGIFIFIVFLNVLLPGRKWLTAVFTVLLFTWWKSSLSGSFIHWMNAWLYLPVQRTIDYTDLLALLIIPVALRLRPYQFNIEVLNKIIKPAAFLFCVIVLCATSMYRYPYISPLNQVNLDKTYTTRLHEEEILQKLDSLHIVYEKDSIEMYPAAGTRDYYLRIDHGKDSAVEWVPVEKMENPKLYYRVTSTPFYKVPVLPLENDTLHNVKFRIKEDNRKKRVIELISMEIPGDFDYIHYMRPRVYKKYQALIKSILTK